LIFRSRAPWRSACSSAAARDFYGTKTASTDEAQTCRGRLQSYEGWAVPLARRESASDGGRNQTH
ncbi:unnamed protein product, partial [Ascophyllum nodosum]